MEIYIRGSIGPGLADKLLHLLAQEPTARRIVITSPGGWVKEAVEIASLVAKSGTDVVARQTCNSACILVLLAAHKRYADWDMAFGFHIPVDLVPNRDGTFARASSAGVKFIERIMTDHHGVGGSTSPLGTILFKDLEVNRQPRKSGVSALCPK